MEAVATPRPLRRNAWDDVFNTRKRKKKNLEEVAASFVLKQYCVSQ